MSALLFVGGFEMSFSPFKVSLPYWSRSVAVILIVLALIFYSAGEYIRGVEDATKQIEKLI